ncbi:GNAT family N-acetyltransferase [Oceanobacillus massiliensis]|uniref:GNAT family N-acetyltransferase n=1 Tax=Oceanobacillus massiliensis TaxID=1465765 RepID=UPI0002892C2C|nr:GNAT family N-acetyltransferase [Oceanobacillus massiliensis]
MLCYKTIDSAKDQETVIHFRRDSFIESFGSDEAFGRDEDYIVWLQRKIADFPEGFVMLWDKNKPVGQLELSIKIFDGKEIGYVHLFYLIPEKRGSGLGDELHRYAMQFFRQYGVSEYYLRVAPANKRACGFYQKKGMEKTADEMDGKVIRMRGYVSVI